MTNPEWIDAPLGGVPAYGIEAEAGLPEHLRRRQAVGPVSPDGQRLEFNRARNRLAPAPCDVRIGPELVELIGRERSHCHMCLPLAYSL